MEEKQYLLHFFGIIFLIELFLLLSGYDKITAGVQMLSSMIIG